jgi:hypothetical protein
MNGHTSADISDASQESIDTVRDLQLAMMQEAAKLEGQQPELRGQHPKQHGCALARFEVLPDIPDRLKVGLFARPATYTAYVRFSNGRVLDDDNKPDIHGMAIKLTGVDGRKVLEDEAEAKTHDFILVDHPVFFVRTADDYAEFFRDKQQFIGKLKRDGRKAELLAIMGLQAGHRQDSPLAARYWSEVPYAFGAGGKAICRYSTIPHDGNFGAVIPEAERGPNYLRDVMAQHLTRYGSAARFDFALQVREDATPAVIDNPTVAWDTLYERVAVITIPPQEFDTPERHAFGENLSYTPWHALPEHRPIGQVNEVRKAVYLASSTLRHETRHTPCTEPTGTEDWS